MNPLPFSPSRTKLFGVSRDHLGYIGEGIGWFYFFPIHKPPAPNYVPCLIHHVRSNTTRFTPRYKAQLHIIYMAAPDSPVVS